MKKRFLSMFLAAMMVFTLLPTVAMAGGVGDLITDSDGVDHVISYDTPDMTGNGWSWDSASETLTLDEFHGKQLDLGGFVKTLVLAEGSINTISGLNLTPHSNFNIKGTGQLIIDNTDGSGGSSVFGPFTITTDEENGGTVIIFTPLQVTGGMETGANEALTFERLYGPNAPSSAVSSNGDVAKAQYVRIAPADSESPPIFLPPDGIPTITAPTFPDVPAGEWYAGPVDWAVENEITNGTSTATFSPYQNCTQAQILTFLYRAARGNGAASAADMDAAVSWAKEKSIIDDTFDGSKPCTRATAVSYIWQAMGKSSAKASSFTDVPASAAYAKAVDWALANGVTNGTTETTFGPDEVCNRGQIVTFLHRAYVEEARLTVK